MNIEWTRATVFSRAVYLDGGKAEGSKISRDTGVVSISSPSSRHCPPRMPRVGIWKTPSGLPLNRGQWPVQIGLQRFWQCWGLRLVVLILTTRSGIDRPWAHLTWNFHQTLLGDWFLCTSSACCRSCRSVSAVHKILCPKDPEFYTPLALNCKIAAPPSMVCKSKIVSNAQSSQILC